MRELPIVPGCLALLKITGEAVREVKVGRSVKIPPFFGPCNCCGNKDLILWRLDPHDGFNYCECVLYRLDGFEPTAEDREAYKIKPTGVPAEEAG